MRRFYLPPHECQPNDMALAGGEARHAADVLRIRPGDEIAVLDGEGREFVCRVTNVGRKRVQLEIVQTAVSPPAACAVTLIQAVPKGKIFESIIQKATELGVSRIIPLLSERVTTHLEGESLERKAERWRQTAVEAIKQSGQRRLPKVDAPVTLPTLMYSIDKYDLALFGALQPGARHPREYFTQFEKNNSRRPASVVAWIGPEGDFSPAEAALIENSGARPITLGPLILRSETAALYTLSIINYELSSPAR